MARYADCYDLVIIGNGVTGAAAAFIQNYGNFRTALSVERQAGAGMVNSNRRGNAQTLHRGLEETNYALEKAFKVDAGAALVDGFIDNFAPQISNKLHKMVIGVGEAEAADITARYHEFKPHFPNARLLDADAIGEIEPQVMRGRDPKQKIVALSGGLGRAVDYQKLAEKMTEFSGRGMCKMDRVYNLGVSAMRRLNDGSYEIAFGRDKVRARAVIVAAGSPSLAMAHRMNEGMEYGMLPMGGDFWVSRNILNGKVYGKQHPLIPFARLHGDAAVYDPGETRWGPTCKPAFLLERDNWDTLREFAQTGMFSWPGISTAVRNGCHPVIGRFLLRNLSYGLPIVGKRLLLNDLRIIVPSLQMDELQRDKGSGGIRGQLVHLPTRTIARGADKIVCKDNRCVFIMAPSPGASYCLGNALEDMRMLMKGLPDFHFEEETFFRDLDLEGHKTCRGITTVEMPAAK